MALWVSLLALASISGCFATAPKDMISLHPPWTIAFKGENVTLTCNSLSFNSSPENTWSIWNNGRYKQIQTQGNTYEAQESGEYRCQNQRSAQSDPVHLSFTSADLLLQPPGPVFEGDPVVLRCRERPGSALKEKTLYKNNLALGVLHDDGSDFHIRRATLRDNGLYQCKAFRDKDYDSSVASNTVKIQVQDLIPRPVLRVSPTKPAAGSPVTLTCEAQLPPQRSDVQLQFCFFREGHTLGRHCSSSPELRVPGMWPEDTGSYCCQAQAVTRSVTKTSMRTYIPVQGAVVSVQIQTRPPPGAVFEGQELVLTCSVHGDSRPISFSWYRRPQLPGATKTSPSRDAEFRISKVMSADAGDYYCVATISHKSIFRPRDQTYFSKTVTIQVRVPASPPVLTLTPPRTWALEGDVMTFRCEARRGSLPILYRLFHEDQFLKEGKAASPRARSFRFALTAEHSGNYYCTADNGLGAQRSEAVTLSVQVPVSRPVLTLRTPRAQAVVGDTVELHCEAQRGSPPILYRFYHDDVALGSSSAPSGGGTSFSLSLTAEHSGNYSCEADNGLGAQRSAAVPLSVTVPASRPVLALRTPRAQAVVGDTAELHCEAQTGSPPILYRFYHDDVALGSSSAPSGGGTSFSLSLTAEHSGNYSCEADNGLGAQRSEVVPLSVTVPASQPVLTLRTPGAQAVVGDTVELHCEAQRGSPPILYRFYHDDVALGNSSAPSGGGVSFNLTLTAEHSGNYSCEADNGLGAQRSAAVTLSIPGLMGSRGGRITTGVTGVLLSLVGLAAMGLLFYCWLPGRAGGRTACDAPSSPSDLDPQEPTYNNMPHCLEMQPVYTNVNPRGGDVVYSEIRRVPDGDKRAAAATPRLLEDKDSKVIYAQVKAASTPGSRPHFLAFSAPHR